MEITQYKPYRLYIKDREPIALTEAQGEGLNRWWMESKPSHKMALNDDKGDYVETILSSQITGIEKKKNQAIKRDKLGNIDEQGFRCDWGSWHPIADIKKEHCECWDKFGMHHAKMFQKLRERYPHIHTCKDITKEMQEYILLANL